MPKASRNEIYDAAIRRMVAQALEEREAQFSKEHAEDTDEQLLRYLKVCAEQLHYSPRPKEITGWSTIAQRFGTWENALLRAGLAPVCPKGGITTFTLYREETERQKHIYRQKKAQKKQQAQEKKNAQNLKRIHACKQNITGSASPLADL